MLGATSADPNPEASGVSPWLLATIVALLVASFAVGAVVFGLGGTARRPAPVAADSGCRERELAYGLSDDAEVQQRMAVAERAPIPGGGFYTAATTPSREELLHAGSHGFVVVRYRVADEAVGPLRRLIVRKADDGAVLAAPAAAPAPPLTGTVWGRVLRCDASGARELRALERFIDSVQGDG
ncbi:MAG: hypothetical protein QOD55_1106 [Solirubrobacteraceae bacterium]|jgi:hypothetical protein|nr:hypothetical protein [Solirubrobacteraceae bacterium]MEA2289109.1 hypothetical protein [Solirubrobacteraceae bacterium]